MAKAKPTPKDILAHRPGSNSPVAAWFAANEDGRVLVEEWVKMRAKGETPHGARWVADYLKRNHGFPYGKDALLHYSQRFRP